MTIQNNVCELIGQVFNYPTLKTIQPPHCLLFDLEVHANTMVDSKVINIFQVVEFGLKAQVDYYYLQPGAWIRIKGHIENDNGQNHKGDLKFKVKPHRAHIVNKHAVIIVAEFIAFGEGCDMERGRRQMSEIIQTAEERGDTHVEERLDLFRKFSSLTHRRESDPHAE